MSNSSRAGPREGRPVGSSMDFLSFDDLPPDMLAVLAQGLDVVSLVRFSALNHASRSSSSTGLRAARDAFEALVGLFGGDAAARTAAQNLTRVAPHLFIVARPAAVFAARLSGLADIFGSDAAARTAAVACPRLLAVASPTAVFGERLHALGDILGGDAARSIVGSCPGLLTNPNPVLAGRLAALADIFGDDAAARTAVVTCPRLLTIFSPAAVFAALAASLGGNIASARETVQRCPSVLLRG